MTTVTLTPVSTSAGTIETDDPIPEPISEPIETVSASLLAFPTTTFTQPDSCSAVASGEAIGGILCPELSRGVTCTAVATVRGDVGDLVEDEEDIGDNNDEGDDGGDEDAGSIGGGNVEVEMVDQSCFADGYGGLLGVYGRSGYVGAAQAFPQPNNACPPSWTQACTPYPTQTICCPPDWGCSASPTPPSTNSLADLLCYSFLPTSTPILILPSPHTLPAASATIPFLSATKHSTFMLATAGFPIVGSEVEDVPTPDTEESDNADSAVDGGGVGGSIRAGAIVAIVFGIIGFFAFAALGAWLYFYLKRKKAGHAGEGGESGPNFRESAGGEETHDGGGIEMRDMGPAAAAAAVSGEGMAKKKDKGKGVMVLAPEERIGGGGLGVMANGGGSRGGVDEIPPLGGGHMSSGGNGHEEGEIGMAR